MIELDRRSLIKQLNPRCVAALNDAVGLCVNREHYEVTIDHYLETLLRIEGGDVLLLLRAYGMHPERLRMAAEQSYSTMRTGNQGRPVFSPLLIEWLQEAWLLGSVEYGATQLRSGLLLLTLVLRASRYASGPVGSVLSAIGKDEIRRDFFTHVADGAERPAEAAAGAGAAAAPGVQENTALGKYAVNFTEQARNGTIDPVFGRDDEIRQMVDILARRRKNNPLIVGEPGVGKTAVVEGLALRVVQGDVPDVLAQVEIWSLDLGALEAGAGVRGEYENRLRAVIEEVKSSPRPIILFIDEAHNLVGGSSSSGDAANLLKPALARGELRTIAATTWKEYKKYFEKDAALARRFELVHVPEPDPQKAVMMLRGLAARYAEVHKVHIRDDAVVAAVELSHRYLTGRQLPDKAVGLLDTAAARVRIGQSVVPTRLDGLRRKTSALERELAAQERDLDARVPGAADQREVLREEIAAIQAQIAEVETAWNRERELVSRVVAIRASGEQKPELEACLIELGSLQGQRPMVFPDVGPDTVAAVVSDWTGIPVGKMLQDDIAAVTQFERTLSGRVKGQDHALAVIGDRLRQARAGLHDPTQPLGVFLLVGPSGVGKTETALGLADLLYGGERSLVTINMSEFQEKHTVSRLIGSPPGYVGFGEGGQLTEAVRQRPYSVVLLDEVEKADPEVLNLFYQVFDKGSLSDGEGRDVDFRNTAVLLTSNLASAEIMQVLEVGEPESHEELVAYIRPILSKHFKPALLARMTIIPYYPLKPATLRSITSLKLGKVAARIKKTHSVDLQWDAAVEDAIVARCTEVETGARNVDHILKGAVMPRLAGAMLSRMGEGAGPGEIRLTVLANGGIDVWNPSAVPSPETTPAELPAEVATPAHLVEVPAPAAE